MQARDEGRGLEIEVELEGDGGVRMWPGPPGAITEDRKK